MSICKIFGNNYLRQVGLQSPIYLAGNGIGYKLESLLRKVKTRA
jgi:hypothetical protein